MPEPKDTPAFPHLGLYPGQDGNLHPTPTQYTGLTIRDYFAGQALAFCLQEFAGNAEDQTQYAEAAYQIADAMLKHRDAG